MRLQKHLNRLKNRLPLGGILLFLVMNLLNEAHAQSPINDAIKELEKEVKVIVEEKKSIYSGGMLIFQPGTTITSNDVHDINAPSFAIGGILRFYIGKQLTAGIYGGSQKTTYISANSKNSYFNLGYGGPFVGWTRKWDKTRATVSAFAGMGSISNLHIESQTGEVLTDAYLYEHSTFIYSPIISLDYALTKRLSLTFQTICLIGSFDNDKRFYNPTMQVGLLFTR